MRRVKPKSALSALGLVAVAAVYLLFGSGEQLLRTDNGARTGSGSGEAEIEAAFENRRSGFMVDLRTVVAKKLPDDNDGSRHQRFLVRLSSGHTVLVAHNIDLAPRVPLQKGDEVRIRGQYEWNERGGVLHWTHHDPDGRRAGGSIEFGGQTYQ